MNKETETADSFSNSTLYHCYYQFIFIIQ